NVDVVFLVCALDGDLNLRRLERYLVVARASGADPVIVLTKTDLEQENEPAAAREAIAGGAPVHAISNLTGAGIDELRGYFAGHRTVALLGSSGAGKSSLVNRLSNTDHQSVGPMGVDGRGKHTTTHR